MFRAIPTSRAIRSDIERRVARGQTDEEIEQAYEESRKMAFIGEMAAVLAHEIRNPLASISGSIQVLKKSLKFVRKFAEVEGLDAHGRSASIRLEKRK